MDNGTNGKDEFDYTCGGLLPPLDTSNLPGIVEYDHTNPNHPKLEIVIVPDWNELTARKVVKQCVREWRRAFPKLAHIPIHCHKRGTTCNLRYTFKRATGMINNDEKLSIMMAIKGMQWWWENGYGGRNNKDLPEWNDKVYGANAIRRLMIHELGHAVQYLHENFGNWDAHASPSHGREHQNAMRLVNDKIGK